MLKQVIIVRKDLKLEPGKLAAQVAHASVECVLKTPKKDVGAWREDGAKKVVLQADGEKELVELKKLADREKLRNALIRDAGRTVLKPGTTTCLGIGPDAEQKIDKVSGRLKML